MKEDLNGISWSPRHRDFQLPFAGNPQKACFACQKNIVPITWNFMRLFENNPVTLAQTAAILAGWSLGEISAFDRMQVKNYADGAKALISPVKQNQFALNAETACLLHQFVGKEDALEWGVLRKSDVSLHNISYTPPTQNLAGLIAKGFAFLSRLSDPIEKAIGTFLFMSRNQPFYDANKRTASLMMNGCLLAAGYFPITVLNKNSEEFHTTLGEFYGSGNADKMFDFFEMTISCLYSEEQLQQFPKVKTHSGPQVL